MPWIPEHPAHEGLTVSWPRLVPADDKSSREIAEALGGSRVQRILGTPRRSWVVDTADRGRLFVRGLPAEHAARHRLGDRFAVYLRQNGLAPPTLIPLDHTLTDGSALLAWPWVDGRFTQSTVSDMHSLGSMLAIAHAALRRVPQPMADEVRARASRRDHGVLRAIDSSERLCALTTEGVAAFGPLPWPDARTPSQVVHGDINSGNVLWSSDGFPHLVDFEDTPWAWRHPATDVAAALERFVLTTGRDEEMVRHGRALLAGYGEAPWNSGRELGAILVVRNLAALALLEGRRGRGDDGVESEARKFEHLMRSAAERMPVLNEISRPHLAIGT